MATSKIRALRGLVLLVLLPGPVRGAIAPREDCRELLPQVLNVGLPAGRELSQNPERVRDAARKVFSEMYESRGLCSGRRQLQVNLATGDDYQILDWLGQGLIDVAVVPHLSEYLLLRDGVDLVELEPIDPKVADLLAPASAYRPLSHAFRSGAWSPRPDPAADFEQLRWQVWCGLFKDGEQPGPDSRSCAQVAAAPRHRLALASHLSTNGFLRPVGETASWLQARPGMAHLADDQAHRLADRFWDAFFARVRYTLDGEVPDPAAAEGDVEIVAGNAPPSAAEPADRNHLVITARAAAQIFHPGLRPLSIEVPGDLLTVLEQEPPYAAFRPLLAPEPYFGVRTYGFTVPESMALLRRHQRTSGRAQLALILPGGGVKAVYQSKLVDSLYAGGYLKNVLTRARPGKSPVDVDFVVGTSGGALLGYFVARLAENGPWNLSQVLWENKDGKTLDSTDIFGWADLPRYLSIVSIFAVFVLLLMVAALLPNPPFPVERPPERGAWRPRLLLTVVPLLLLAPLLIRWVNARHTEEHVPEIEGLFYAICASIAMFADQCLILRPKERAEGRGEESHELRLRPAMLALLGLGLVQVLLPWIWWPGAKDRWIDANASFLPVFLAASLLGLGGVLILPYRLLRTQRQPLGRRLALGAADFLGVTMLSLCVFLLPSRVWSLAARLPIFLIGLALLLLIAGAAAPRNRRDRLANIPRRGAYYATLSAAALLEVLLWKPKDLGAGPVRVLFRQSGLDLPWGSFLLCAGMFCLLAAAILWAYESPRYRLEEVRDFQAGFSVSLFLVVAVYAVLGLVMYLKAEWFSPLELTGGFWAWLLGVSFFFGLALLLFGLRPRGWWTSRVSRGIVYLSSPHPNGSLVSRRALRIAFVLAGSFLWWNLVLAPGLYGNAHAREFLRTAVDRFNCYHGMANQGADFRRLTAQLIVPANLLAVDGTRYFLVLPGDLDACPPISNRPGSGALWYTYRIQGTGGSGRPRDCRNFRDKSLEDVENVVFASGSPFPIFPAHLVDLEDDKGTKSREALVDGGYSNNEPVDAALNVSAEQVLIVESTNPLGPPPAAETASASQPAHRSLSGPLVAELLRLPGFLYERSQQVDRLSRRGLFVVSLAPARDRTDWPLLFDFREKVVNDLRRAADEDLARRIGTVESWGLPRFQMSVLVDGV